MGHWVELTIRTIVRTDKHISVKKIVEDCVRTGEMFYKEETKDCGSLRSYIAHVTFEQDGDDALKSITLLNMMLRRACNAHSIDITNMRIW